MARVFGLPLVLVSLAVGGFLFVRQMQTDGPTAPAVTQMITQIDANVAGANFASAVPAMQAWFTEKGTYAGATLPPSAGAGWPPSTDTGCAPSLQPAIVHAAARICRASRPAFTAPSRS